MKTIEATDALPPLPQPALPFSAPRNSYTHFYSAEQMREYALAAISLGDPITPRADDGYREAFYAIAGALGVIPDGVSSPKHVFESVMFPRIAALARCTGEGA